MTSFSSKAKPGEAPGLSLDLECSRQAPALARAAIAGCGARDAD